MVNNSFLVPSNPLFSNSIMRPSSVIELYISVKGICEFEPPIPDSLQAKPQYLWQVTIHQTACR